MAATWSATSGSNGNANTPFTDSISNTTTGGAPGPRCAG